MAGILMDLETGDPYLDENGNTVKVTKDFAFGQIIDGLLHCQPGSELLNPYYGFDLNSAIRESSIPDAELFIESLVTDALDPKKEKLIAKINMVQAWRENNNNMKVYIAVTSIIGETYDGESEISAL
jgi:phage baseplate assembly protein W